MRVVYDTNIFVSAFTMPGGRGEAAVLRAARGEVQLVLSPPLIHEVLGVLARKFARDREDLARVAVFLSELATMVTPHRTLAVLRDEPDNRILECAAAGKAGLVVTGDRAMLALEQFEEIRIVSLREFLALR